MDKQPARTSGFDLEERTAKFGEDVIAYVREFSDQRWRKLPRSRRRGIEEGVLLSDQLVQARVSRDQALAPHDGPSSAREEGTSEKIVAGSPGAESDFCRDLPQRKEQVTLGFDLRHSFDIRYSTFDITEPLTSECSD